MAGLVAVVTIASCGCGLHPFPGAQWDYDQCFWAYGQATCDPHPEDMDIGELELLPEQINAVEGDFLYCPDVDDCGGLDTQDASDLLCDHAAEQEFSTSLGLRIICGPVVTAYGDCCFHVDTSVYYQD